MFLSAFPCFSTVFTVIVMGRSRVLVTHLPSRIIHGPIAYDCCSLVNFWVDLGGDKCVCYWEKIGHDALRWGTKQGTQDGQIDGGRPGRLVVIRESKASKTMFCHSKRKGHHRWSEAMCAPLNARLKPSSLPSLTCVRLENPRQDGIN